MRRQLAFVLLMLTIGILGCEEESPSSRHDAGDASQPDAEIDAGDAAHVEPDADTDAGSDDASTGDGAVADDAGIDSSSAVCPDDFIHVGGGECAPTLKGLVISAGVIAPAFDPAVTSYRVRVGYDVTSIDFTLDLPDDIAATLDGAAITDGTQISSGVLDFGDNTFSMVASAVDHPSRTYSIVVQRLYQEAYLPGFATSVYLALDGDTLVVGDPSAQSQRGAVHVLVRSAGVWTEQALLQAAQGEASDRFGGSVSISGDTLVVGASQEDSSATTINGDETSNGAPDAGAAYVFVRSGTTWTQQAYLKASNTDPGDAFGYTVAISADTIAVAAQREASAASGVNGDEANNDAPSNGAVYVYTRSSTTWTKQAYIKSDDPYDVQFFDTVALDGDTLAVGVPSAGDFDNGTAYVFARDSGTWSQQARLVAPTTGGEMDYFGTAVAASGARVAVGAPGVAFYDGEVVLYERSGSTWGAGQGLSAATGLEEGNFANRVALHGDVLLVGSRSAAGTGAGTAYLFLHSGSAWGAPIAMAADSPNPPIGGVSAVAVSADTFAVASGGAVYIFR